MHLTVLGCYGGIGGSRRTIALLLDDDILIDAGSGAGDLTLERMARLEHIFLTHAHLGHNVCAAACGAFQPQQLQQGQQFVF